jgi:hypothetical protein
MTTERLIQRVDELIEMGNAVLRTRHRDNGSGGGDDIVSCFDGPRQHHYSGPEWVDGGKMKGFRTASLSFIGTVYSEKHTHFREFFKTADGSLPEAVEAGMEILRAIRGEITGGWLFTVKSLVTAEVFADFMEMAEYLLESGYKDPAAVIVGSTLEEHLRQLCMKNQIPVARQKDGKDVPLKADQLNSDLTKAGVYTMLDQKLVTAWLDLRNKAAHGEYGEYNVEQVKTMMSGVIEFMARVAV